MLSEVITGESTKRGQFRDPLRRDDMSLIDELSAMGVTVSIRLNRWV
jgi:hypothetical protein